MRPALLATLALLLGFTLMAAASCPFLSVTADPVASANIPGSATYTISILNTGPGTQSITVSSLCDASTLDCSFPDLPIPYLLAPGQSSTVHLVVGTADEQPGTYRIPLQVTGGTPGNACLASQTLILIANSTTAPSTPNATVTASLSPAGIYSGTPGTSVSFKVNVNNPTLQDAYVTLESGLQQGNPFLQSTSIAPVQFMIPAGSSQTSVVTIAIPVGWPGGLNNFPLQAAVSFPDASTTTITLPVQLFVYSPRLFLQLISAPGPTTCVNAFEGNSTSVDIQVANDGDITGPFNVSLTLPGNLTGITTQSQDLFSLNTGEATDTFLNFTPTSATVPGLYFYSAQFDYLGLPAIVYTGCVKVIPVYGLDAVSTQQFNIVRGIAQTIPLSVANNGSTAQNFSVEFDPLPLPGVALSVDQPEFSLAPQQSLTVNFLLQADDTALLGPATIPITFQSTNATTQVSLNVNIVSSNLTGSSPLDIIAPPQVHVFNGLPQQQSITVNNDGQTTLPQVQLLAQGFPEGWVQVLTPPLDIPPSTARTFLIAFNVPADADQPGPRVLYLTAVSGLNSVKAPLLVVIQQAVNQLDYAVTGFSQTSSGPQVNLNLTVTNTGNIPETGITPSIPYATGYAVSALPISLAPGQSGYLNVAVAPTANDAQSDVFLQVASVQGASKTNTVRLPAMSPSGSVSDYTPQLVAIIILLVAIAAVVKRDEVEQALSG